MKPQKQQTETRPRKRWIVIGPGIVLAMILAIQIVIAGRQRPAGPPIVERQVIDSGMGQNSSPTPDVGYILDRGDRLALSGGQRRTLAALKVDWQSRSKPLTSEMSKAVEEFNAFMKRAGNRVTMGEIQSHVGPVSELSRQVSSLRRVYWEKAMQALTGEQRRVVEKELSRGYPPSLSRSMGGNDR